MKVLWLAGNPSLYASGGGYNGGGWIGALQREIVNSFEDIVLAIAFPWESDFCEHKDSVSYYGVKKEKKTIIHARAKESRQMNRVKEIINDFHPDIIHVFGTESVFGLVCTVTEVPVIIHIQGILSAIFESWLPQNLSWVDYIIKRPKAYIDYVAQLMLKEREIRILKKCKLYMGRTIWDKNLTELLSPESRYFYCSEMLRPQIYNSNRFWQYAEKPTFIISTITSAATYKGADVILKTAKWLTTYTDMKFEWRVYGISDMKLAEKLTGINASRVGVSVMGVISPDELIDVVADTSVYVHPSYIENSSNAICEAQLLGAPVIATHVGGVESLIENGKTGILVPANDSYMLAAQILKLSKDPSLCINLGRNGREVALERHSPTSIVNDLFNIYKAIVK